MGTLPRPDDAVLKARQAAQELIEALCTVVDDLHHHQHDFESLLDHTKQSDQEKPFRQS